MNANLAREVEAAMSRLRGGVSAADIEGAVGSPLPTGLFSQETWALVAFLRHERRQRWVGHIVESRCFLAMISDDWCIEALVQAANGPVERGGHEAACALSLLDNGKAQSAAMEWQRRNDGYEEAEGKEVEIGGKKVRTWIRREFSGAAPQLRTDGCALLLGGGGCGSWESSSLRA